MEETKPINKIMQCSSDDVDALMGYIKKLEISLAKKDELLKAKDEQINTLESKVKKNASAMPVFRETATDDGVTPRGLNQSTVTTSTPNQVSDDSGEVEPGSEGSLSHSLSHISHVNSTEEDDEAIAENVQDGRWNIPFDSFDNDDLVAKSPSRKGAGHENALKDIGFVPIGSEDRHGRLSTGADVTPVRPVARSLVASPFALAYRKKSAMTEKENKSPKRSSISPRVGSLRDIR